MRSRLRGATHVPAEAVESANAGEFAARWNAMTPAEREEVFRIIMENQRIAFRAWVMDIRRSRD